jgi:hypothetical protein
MRQELSCYALYQLYISCYALYLLYISCYALYQLYISCYALYQFTELPPSLHALNVNTTNALPAACFDTS